MFSELLMAPPDPILGLTEAFKEDPNPEKINLGVGVYKDGQGRTPIMTVVKKAEALLLEREDTKNYMPIGGSPEYAAVVQDLLFGAGHPIIASRRAGTIHTPGGTGALRVAGDFLKTICPETTLWLSDPTWANHGGIFTAAGLKMASYPYYDHGANGLDFDAMTQALEQIPEGDAVLLHGCCHNPTGADPTPDQWRVIADIVARRGLFPVIDFAYQGLADGCDVDAQGLRAVCESSPEALICSSFSKNFGLYNERVGALTLVAADNEAVRKAISHMKVVVRRNYSNPPFHGGAIVSLVLSDAALRAEWEEEVAVIRDRINRMRRLFVDTLSAQGVDQDFSFITRQRGMFSFSGLTRAQVDRLRDEYAIYIVGSGRVNVAGMSAANMDHLCGAIATVLKG